MVDEESFSAEQDGESSISEPWTFGCKLEEPLAKTLWNSSPTAIALHRASLPYEAARATFAQLEGSLSMIDRRAARRRAYHFFETIDFSA